MQLCKDCPYRIYARIPPTPPKGARLMIVGEAPGTTELVKKKPFVGAAGKLLRKALVAHGINPDTAFITNALLCKPATATIQRTPIEICRSRLLREVEAVNPELILALGNTAVFALTGDYHFRITREQGRLLDSPLLPGYKILPALHPAKILRAPGDYKVFSATVQYAADLLKGQPPRDPGLTTYKIIDSPEQLSEVIEFLQREVEQQDREVIVAADIETSGLNPRRNHVLVLGVAYAKNKVWIFPREVLRELRPLFLVSGVKWCWHNGKFDVSFLRRMGLPAIVHHDTMLLHYCLNETSGTHDLEQLAAQYLGGAPYKHKANKHKSVKTKKGFAGLPLDILYERVATDADYTLQLYHVLRPPVEEDLHLRKLYHHILIPASSFLRRVERNGLYINREFLLQLEKEFAAKVAEKEQDIIDMAMEYWDPVEYVAQTGRKSASEVFKPTSPHQLAWLLYDKFGLKPKKKTRSTDEATISPLKNQHPIIPLILDFRSERKEYATYIAGFLNRIASDGRVHTTYSLHVTTTGRLSSRNPNVQNIPKEKPLVRNMVQAPPGKILMEADYKGAELRVLALLSGDVWMRQVFAEGRDLHTEVEQALNIPRIKAKTLNFGIPYGRTAYSIAEEFNMSEAEAQKMIDDWFARAPQAATYLKECDAAVVRGETLISPFGRKRRFGLVSSGNLEELQREARNFRIQGVASDLTLLSGMRLEPRLKPYNAMIINLIHDAILFELPEDPEIIKRVAKIVRETMMQVPFDELSSDIPFEVDIKVGHAWGSLEELPPEE